jgi:hypothetical protein
MVDVIPVEQGNPSSKYGAMQNCCTMAQLHRAVVDHDFHDSGRVDWKPARRSVSVGP